MKLTSKTRHALLFLIVSGLALLLWGCKEMKNATLRYADGSGNSYIVSPRPTPQLMYQPVKPAFSSSGMYDGGEPLTRKLTPTEHGRILELVRAALENTSVHIKDRVKMSGAIHVKPEQGEEVSVILKPGCTEQTNLESYLNDLRKK